MSGRRQNQASARIFAITRLRVLGSREETEAFRQQAARRRKDGQMGRDETRPEIAWLNAPMKKTSSSLAVRNRWVRQESGSAKTPTWVSSCKVSVNDEVGQSGTEASRVDSEWSVARDGTRSQI